MVNRIIRNDRTGRTVATGLTNAELAARFAETAPENNWLWFFIAQHVNESTPSPEKTKNAEMRDFLADSFVYAVGMGLKRPMIRLVYANWRYKVYLSARGTVCFKAGRVSPGTTDPIGDETYIGCIFGGKFLPIKDRSPTSANLQFLQLLSTDPVNFMAKCSKDMNRCCYCNLPLEDARSKEVGYGPICAGRWGLPWGEVSGSKHVRSFAGIWRDANAEDRKSIRGVCKAIRTNPRDELAWAALGDIMEEAGHSKRPTMPATSVKVPACV